MSSHNRHMVRAHGVNLRSTLLNAHSQFGDNVGLAVVDRYLFEIGDLGGEIHGRRKLAERMYAAADRLVREDDDAPAIDLPDDEVEEEPHVEEAPAKSGTVTVFGWDFHWRGSGIPLVVAFFFGILVGFAA